MKRHLISRLRKSRRLYFPFFRLTESLLLQRSKSLRKRLLKLGKLLTPVWGSSHKIFPQVTTDKHMLRPLPSTKSKHKKEVDSRQKGDDVLEQHGNAVLMNDFDQCLRIPTILSIDEDLPDRPDVGQPSFHN